MAKATMADFHPTVYPVSEWAHAHSTVRVGIPACFIFGCLLTFVGLCGIAAAR